jgi:hypothetical protein
MAHRSRPFGFIVGLLLLLVVAALASVSAQAPASRLLSISVVSVKPEMMRAYTDYLKSDVVPALQKGGVKWRDTWRTAVFGDTFEIAHVTEIKGFEQYDSPAPLRTALGEAGYAAYLAKVGPMLAGQQTYAVRTRPDLSYMADPAYRPKMAILTEVEIANDKVMEFEAFIKNEWIPALKKGGGKHYSVVQVLYGGAMNQYMTLVGIDTFADLAKGHPVTRALGDEGLNKLSAKSGGFAHHIERKIIRLDPDLSFEVKTTSEAR